MKTLVIAAGSLCAVLSAGADSIRARNFANPPSDMRLLPCLNGWNEKAIERANAAGFGGAACSCAWTKDYLRDEGDWKGFASFARQANKAGLSLWLYDEYGYPSGTAGFGVLEGHPELQARGALIAYEDVAAGEEASVPVPPGNRLGAAALPLVDGRVDAARQREIPLGEGGTLVWRAPEGGAVKWRVCAFTEDAVYTNTHSQASLVLKAPYINMLDPRATKRFIELTHERYAAHFEKDEFQKIFRSTFTDEPALTQWVREAPYLNLPWAHDLPDEYKAATGRDIVRDLPCLAFETVGPEGPSCRYAYRHIVGERVKRNYFGQIANWCREHGIWSGGHLFAEEAVAAHAGLYGDFFGCMRALTAPGMDCLCPYPQKIGPLVPLYASSAADLNGEGAPVMCEFSDYGCQKGMAPPTRAETIGNAYKLIAGGITEFTNYHRLRAFKSDAEKRRFNEIVGRAIALTKGTRSAADVALFYPCESIQAAFIPAKNGCGGDENFAIDRDLKAAADALYAASRSFLIVDSDSLVKAKIEKDELVFGKNRWKAVVLPRAKVLPVEVAEKLSAFKRAGGCVVATGARPESSTTEFPSAAVGAFGASLDFVEPSQLGETVARAVPPAIRFPEGLCSIRVLHRQADDGDVFFLYNDSPSNWTGIVEFEDGRKELELWRPAEGEHHTVRSKDGRFRVRVLGNAAVAFTAPEKGKGFEFSRAGYWEAPDSPRTVASMNPGWEFSLDGFKTSKAVNLPHSIDEGEIGLNASGCVNRQQKAWYRKTFAWWKTQAKSFLHFEAVMGKCVITVNGKEVARHFGGFLPIHIDVTDILKDGENTVEVVCDNSNDPNYPPGKAQDVLDWTYFGGIYRDVWLLETGESYVADTDNGGVYVTSKLEDDGSWSVTADVNLMGEEGATVALFYDGEAVTSPFKPTNPALWTPDEPNLHRLDVRVSRDGRETDAVTVKFGIRDFTLDTNGVTLNGKPFRKLMGVNRHQDFAYIGMALPNSLHWRDAKKYRDAGCTIIRNAHYPQDPAFMDACDALGLFVIENPPGWQFWNDKNPEFERRVYDDILKMVRRDRSRASLFMWEPILNETRYPADFAHNARALVKRETRAPNYCACDKIAGDSSEYDIIYTRDENEERPHFIREWGDCPDDWCAQNSPSRVPIEWGEGPMLVQAEHYCDVDYFICHEQILRRSSALSGACMWHGADHSRGYHPDNFFGGLLSYDRRKKYSWYAMKARQTKEPFVFLANALAPYSPQTFTIFSNCAYTATWLGKEVRNGDRMDRGAFKKLNYSVVHEKDAYRTRTPELDFVITLANGTSVTNHHAGRFVKIGLELDTEGMQPVGDGSDLVVCRAILQDENGIARRYQTEDVVFSAEGPVQIVGENPQRTRFGEASVLLRPLAPGKITMTASIRRSIGDGEGRKVDLVYDCWKGDRVPSGSVLEFTALPTSGLSLGGMAVPTPVLGPAAVLRKASETSLREVEQQQKDFME